tara:strand:- start:41 stop:991 length:951 start_codon:yes stop_codon:yes gene_type:complete
MLYEAFISEANSKSRLVRKGLVVGKRALGKFKRGKGRNIVRKVTKVKPKGGAIVPYKKGGSLVKSPGGKITPTGKGGAIVKSPGGKLGKPKGGALAKRPAGGRWAQAADFAGQAYDLRRDRQQFAQGIRQDRDNRSSAFKKAMDTINKPKLVDSGSKFGRSVAHGSGVGGSMGQIGALAKGAAQFASGAIGDEGKARLARRGKILGAKAKQQGRRAYQSFQKKPTPIRDPGLRMQKPGWRKNTEKPLTLGQKARRDAALKRKLQQQREEFSCWREDFVWEADKKYPSGEKEKIIDVMKGKNTIEINPTVEDDKYKR